MATIDEIRIEQVCFSYDNKLVLKDVTLTAKKGRITAILGPNGAGKTTLFKVLDLLLVPTAGHILSGNKDILAFSSVEATEWRRSIAFVLQEPYLFNLTVKKNIAVPLSMRKLPQSEIDQRVQETIDTFGLKEIAEKKTHKLSSGERKRVGLARALITRPGLLILDEPTASIDPETCYMIEKLLLNKRSEGKTIILMSTHDMFQAKRIADDAGLLHKGVLVEFGPKSRFFDSPRNDLTRRFVNGEILIDHDPSSPS
nr:ATP-binding cassette domain-containing protein [Candidatus Sigynarchaeota archaeon]